MLTVWVLHHLSAHFPAVNVWVVPVCHCVRSAAVEELWSANLSSNIRREMHEDEGFKVSLNCISRMRSIWAM